MINIYQPQPTKILSVRQESEDTKLFRLQFQDKNIQSEFAFMAGQFMQVGLPGWGECPISICSSPHHSQKYFELAVRGVGRLSNKINSLKVGDTVDMRGPYGNGFDVNEFKDKPLLLIGGGCGFVPLRPLILDFMAGRLENSILQVFYGCLNEKTLLFKNNYKEWERHIEFNVILDKPSAKWQGEKGMVTDLFKTQKITPNTTAVIVGPPVMYKFVIKELEKKKVKPENIFVSLEKRMHCGVGVCQHCAIGPYYVCKDGPVFRWSEIKDYII